MSRVSDTRLRTREAAINLVAAGRRPHELTVDLIYAEIKQGSRTTINDELKLWKDEQAKADALNSILPPAVANAMMNTWTIAIEHGEKVFEQRREELENELATALQSAQELEDSLTNKQEEITSLQAQSMAYRVEIETLRNEVANSRSAADKAQAQVTALAQQLESSRNEEEQRLALAKAEYQQRIAELQSTITTQEQAFRTEIDKVTMRLEGVQKHIMLQLTEARDSTKRVEATLAKANLKNEELSVRSEQLAAKLTVQTEESRGIRAELEQACQENRQLRGEYDLLIQQHAIQTGKSAAQIEQIEAMERRAIGAETRLEDVLKRTTRPSKREKKGKSSGD
ncbi:MULTISPECIES: DNA-binding protein [Methylomonas]|uniref:KfrA N-terminal DNA-binding domain-containing protein n=2 Tax=Methylomonas TaxID=416 RepID=A0A140E6U9_9GAMM|nr:MULTISPECIES: DNA-binding protein [Methylomonas]AMK79123.1 hypothetical protein JT25_022010 [Methylomonas denitrificans]OAH99633.1 hypothetical protein A1342_07875 [Methylomonas methanica]TCV78197.1 plasmid replication DNA-binding protein KfrA [Methylomonas methanica]